MCVSCYIHAPPEKSNAQLWAFYIVSDNQGNGLIKQRRYNIIMTVQYIHRVAYHGTTKTRCGWQHVNETGRDRSQI